MASHTAAAIALAGGATVTIPALDTAADATPAVAPAPATAAAETTPAAAAAAAATGTGHDTRQATTAAATEQEATVDDDDVPDEGSAQVTADAIAAGGNVNGPPATAPAAADTTPAAAPAASTVNNRISGGIRPRVIARAAATFEIFGAIRSDVTGNLVNQEGLLCGFEFNNGTEDSWMPTIGLEQPTWSRNDTVYDNDYNLVGYMVGDGEANSMFESVEEYQLATDGARRETTTPTHQPTPAQRITAETSDIAAGFRQTTTVSTDNTAVNAVAAAETNDGRQQIQYDVREDQYIRNTTTSDAGDDINSEDHNTNTTYK